ncbi:MAG: sulfoxide reductase heme-binding subunit YedZ [Anaerolineae bacterium]|nr:sulfoxide reductase heme-binding subunit YedZ [Anaerolineae bacterium]
MLNRKGASWRSATWWRANWFHLLVHGLALWPLAHILWDLAWGSFLVDPVGEILTRTGRASLNLLVLSLACTPFYTLTGFAPLLRARRTSGLYAFLYVALHFLTFAGLDYGFDLRMLWEAVFYQRYVIVGFIAGLILLALAITSTRGWQRRLGKGWKRLQRLVYLANVLAVLHFAWLLKEPRQALPYVAAVAVLLALRVPALARAVGRARRRSVKGSASQVSD